MEAILDDGLPQQAKPLLRLRAELRLLEAEPDPLSSRGWLLHDPLSGRYFRLNQRQVELLGHIDAGDAQQVASAASEALSQPVTADEVERLFTFLRRQNLVDADQRQIGWFRQQRGARPGWMTRFVRGYLFVRIPLVRPDRMLARTLPWVRWLVGPATLPLLLLIAMAGLFLASRQTDQFLTTFLHFFTWQGVALWLCCCW